MLTLFFLYLAMWYIFRIKSIEMFAQQCFCCVSVQVEMPKCGHKEVNHCVLWCCELGTLWGQQQQQTTVILPTLP